MNVRAIKQRAQAVEKTKKIVKAMQVVALTRLKKLEASALYGKMYFEKMKTLVEAIAQDLKNFHPLLQPRKQENRIWIVAIGSDRGLCGNFNANISKAVDRFVDEHRQVDVKIIPVGRKILRHVEKKYPDKLELFLDKLTDKQALNNFLDELQEKAVDSYIANELDAFYILYSEFKGHILGRIKQLRVLPLGEDIAGEKGLKPNFIFEPDEDELLSVVIKEYLSSQVNQTLLESRAAEELSRMLAMKSATDAADKMLQVLMLSYHKARQANITKEIIEIINAQGV